MINLKVRLNKMADWKQIKKNVGDAASKTAKKAEEIAELATLRAKLTYLKAKKDEEFRKLGRLTYVQLKDGTSQAEAIAPVIDELDKINARIAKIKAQIEQMAQEKKQAKASKSQSDEPKTDEDIEAEVQKIIDEAM